MTDYTPTTEQVRAQYADGESAGAGEDYAEFDRWLEEHDRQVGGRGLARGKILWNVRREGNKLHRFRRSPESLREG